MASILEIVLQEEVSPDAVIAWLQKSIVVCILFLFIRFFYEKGQLSQGSPCAIELEMSNSIGNCRLTVPVFEQPPYQ